MNFGVFLLTTIASTEGFIIASGLVTAFLFTRHGIRHGIFFLGSASALMLTVGVMKIIFHVARPEGGLIPVTGYAFPSGHAAGALFLALSLCYLVRRVNKKIRYGIYASALLFALLVGASRIAFVVHTPLQVYAGFAFGAFFAGVFMWLDTRYKKHR